MTAPHQWAPVTVDELAHAFDGVPALWWMVGGVALDLFRGRVTRAHTDIDAEVLRRDATAVHGHFVARGWEVHCAAAGVLTAWDGVAPLSEDCHGLWCRRDAGAAWAFDVKLGASEGTDWVYRREPLVRRPLASLVVHTAGGVPYVAPEVQLLFKAAATRPHDEADFAAVVPALAPSARRWLADALAVAHPEHPWRTALQTGGA